MHFPWLVGGTLVIMAFSNALVALLTADYDRVRQGRSPPRLQGRSLTNRAEA
jgi:hypothetical protein